MNVAAPDITPGTSQGADDRIGIFIDIEGTTALLGNRETAGLATFGICHLVNAVFQVIAGTEGSPRILAHQITDGVLLLPSLFASQADVAIGLTAAIMKRVLLLSGCVPSAGIALGDFFDYRACVEGVADRTVREAIDTQGLELRLHVESDDGVSIFTLSPVIGSALGNAYKVGSHARGPRLLVSHDLWSRMPSASRPPRAEVDPRDVEGRIDVAWPSWQSRMVDEIYERSFRERAPHARALGALYRRYLTQFPLPGETWTRCVDLFEPGAADEHGHS